MRLQIVLPLSEQLVLRENGVCLTKVDSIMEKFDTRDRKSSARGRKSQLGWDGRLIIWITVWNEPSLISDIREAIMAVGSILTDGRWRHCNLAG